MRKKRILVLFPKDWDRLEFSRPRFAGRYEFFFAGFDLFRFPESARLLSFDVRRFIDRLVQRVHRERFDAVVSNNEQFGAMIAAIVAEAAGLPGNDPRAVATAHHKYYARCAVAEVAPGSVPPFAAFPYTVRSPIEVGVPFPCFVKPVKATFSVLARRVDDFATLARHLDFAPLERYLIKRLVRPFNDMTRDLPGFAMDAHHMIAEGLVPGMQFNVDGYVENGRVRIVGVIDEHMYPGTLSFSRFEYPSALPAAVQTRVRDLVERVLSHIGYRHGFFNIELAYDPASNALGVIEINPRLASQLAYLYECVDGLSLYEQVLALALGEPVPPVTPPAELPHFARAASFAYRKFDDRPARVPAQGELAELKSRFPDARLMLYHKRGAGLAREIRWLGSHRYAVLNLGGRDAEDLDRRYMAITRLLGFEREGAAVPRRAHEQHAMAARFDPAPPGPEHLRSG